MSFIIGKGTAGNVVTERGKTTVTKISDYDQIITEIGIYRLLGDLPGVCRMLSFTEEKGKYSVELVRYQDDLTNIVNIIRRNFSPSTPSSPSTHRGTNIITSIIYQVIAAVQLIHAKGVVHGDIKPSNIFCSVETDGKGEKKLVTYIGDFGLAGLTEKK